MTRFTPLSSALRTFIATLPAGTRYPEARRQAAAAGLRLSQRLFYRWRFLMRPASLDQYLTAVAQRYDVPTEDN